jgi:site-specific DNA-methyltransferase (adenine-specific)
MASHYLTDKSQPAIATADLFDRLRPFLPDVPEEIERLVCERTGIEWTAYKQREVVGKGSGAISTRKDLRVDNGTVWGAKSSEFDLTAPATEAAKQWEGWGTALKPALEPITLARKPLIGTVAANVLEHETGGLNIDGCRVNFVSSGDMEAAAAAAAAAQRLCQDQNKNRTAYGKFDNGLASLQPYLDKMELGRFPANFIHDGSEEVLALFPETTSGQPAGVKAGNNNNVFGQFAGGIPVTGFGDSGSAARFFYCAKASRDDRDEGCGALEEKRCGSMQATEESSMLTSAGNERTTQRRNTHSTVKPTDLMRYLCRLITPPNGIVLDPFMGSGSTGKAAMAEGFRFIGIEREAEYIEIARARISAEAEKPRQLSLF